MMNRKILALAMTFGMLIGIAVIVWIYSPRRGVPIGSTVRVAPQFSLEDASGKRHSLSEFQGRPVVIHFWAAWCPPCLEEIPNWIALARKFEGKPLGFIAVSLDSKWEDALKILPVSRMPPNVVSLIDLSGKLAEDYGTYQFPETYLLNSRHEIIHKWVGGQDWNRPEVLKALEQISATSGTAQQ